MATTATSAPVPGGQTNPGRGWVIGLVALAVATIGVVVWAASNDSGDSLASGPTFATAVGDNEPSPTVVVTSLPATSAETTPPTDPPTTPPSTTPPESTTPPTPAPPPELVPGFPDTDDIGQFIEQLRDAKDVAGKQAKKLSDKMKDVLDENDDDEREEKIDELVDQVDEWVEKEELDPIVAGRAIELIDEYDGSRSERDD